VGGEILNLFAEFIFSRENKRKAFCELGGT
jgi:hypothetical protein